MLPQRHVVSAGFNTIEFHVRVTEKCMEYADRVASPADTGEDRSWQLPLLIQDLSSGFSADDALEVAHHCRVWMRAHHGPEEVVRALNVRDPVSQRFVDGVLECLGA